jgi:hypothetical protein
MWVVAAAATVSLLSGCGGSDDAAAPADAPAASAAPADDAPGESEETVEEEAVASEEAPEEPVEEEAELATSFSEGTYEVGVDIAPGTYVPTEELKGICTVAIDATAESEDISSALAGGGGVTADITSTGATYQITRGTPELPLFEGWVVTSYSCGTWAM